MGPFRARARGREVRIAVSPLTGASDDDVAVGNRGGFSGDGWARPRSPATNHGWSLNGSDANTYTVTNRYHSPDRSLFMNGLTGEEQILTRFFAPITHGSITAWVYDDLSEPQSEDAMEINNVNLGLGVETRHGESFYVVWENGLTDNPIVTSVERTEGWHELRVEILPDRMDAYIDGKPVHSRGPVTVTEIQLHCSQHSGSTEEGTTNWDDVRIVRCTP